MRRVIELQKNLLPLVLPVLLMVGGLGAQEKPNSQQKQPQVRVNVLNVCSPTPDDQKELTAALARISRKPKWATDFEVARGRTTLPDQGTPDTTASKPVVSSWTRIRREFGSESPFLNAQYSFSRDNEAMVETLVLRLRDSKDLLEVSMEDTASAVTTPAAMLATNTPINRIKLERFGKPSVVLARCQAGSGGQTVDQSAYETLFRSASQIMSAYRDALAARHTVPAELARVSDTANGGAVQAPHGAKHSAGKH